MKAFNTLTRAVAAAVPVAVCLTGAGALADDPAPATGAVPRPRVSEIPHHAPPAIPAPEATDVTASAASTGFGTTSAFAAKSESLSPQATTLSTPVTLTDSGTSNALTVTDSGTGRGISSTVTNSNSGTGGPAGKFEVTNANSAQAGVYATTSGTGSAIVGTNTTAAEGTGLYGYNQSQRGVGVGGADLTTDSSTAGYGVYGYTNLGIAGFFEP